MSSLICWLCGEISFCTAKNRDVGRLRRKFGSSGAQPVQQLGLGRSRQWGCKIASFTAQLMQGKEIYSLSHQKFILLHLFEIKGRLQTSFWSLSPTLSSTMISLSLKIWKSDRITATAHAFHSQIQFWFTFRPGVREGYPPKKYRKKSCLLPNLPWLLWYNF